MSEIQTNYENVQDKIQRLNYLVAWFDGEDFQLEEAFARFKEAEKLAYEIEQNLDSMKNEIHVLKKRFETET